MAYISHLANNRAAIPRLSLNLTLAILLKVCYNVMNTKKRKVLIINKSEFGEMNLLRKQKLNLFDWRVLGSLISLQLLGEMNLLRKLIFLYLFILIDIF